MKTASRVLGSAAFHAGLTVQDSPVYGAERRGAPMTAFTRIAAEAILERGAIASPDLVVVADDTLLLDPSARPAAGCAAHASLLVNTTRTADSVRRMVSFGGEVLVEDFTALVMEATGKLAGLSTALGVSAAALVGLSAQDTMAGLTGELEEAHLHPDEIENNLVLAREAYRRAASWPRAREGEDGHRPAETRLVSLKMEPAWRAAPSIYATANTPARHTGSWRQFRPILDPDKCSGCWLCFVWCPEAAISLGEGDRPLIDYDVCKGCLLCAHECPTHAFHVEREAR